MEEEPPIYRLPHDTLHQIFSSLPLRQIILCRSLSKFFLHLLSTPSFLHLLSTTLPPPPPPPPPHPPPHHHHHSPLPLFDPDHNTWLHFPLDFLPFHSPLPVASSPGLLYLWAQPQPQAQAQAQAQAHPTNTNTKSLLACNPLTRTFRLLPHLGSAWSRHGTVLVDSNQRVMVLTELAALYCQPHSTKWLKFSSNLPSKPRSPLLMNDSAYALCDVGSPWRSHWKLYTCRLAAASASPWHRLDRPHWGDVLDVLRRPRLVRGLGNRILMVGGLKSSFALNAPCSTLLVLRLDLDTLRWDEAARMPHDMFKCFRDSTKFKAFGAADRVCFSAKRIGKLALWDRHAADGVEWRWIDNLPGNGDGLYRGFVFEGRLNAVP
ncbi:SKP1-interacting partner 15 [Cajanus cajan]|uniref:SKP1-interacting partner 15 n=1 Tax=Cajanus cajan TaxID=3821 RepID=A0A151SQ78_CAJCA|nr:SKP1-interacting partner 15 [Cajanus cajan]KYP56892.1 SKP1-interacting partner 15 [Cajanus cajan]